MYNKYSRLTEIHRQQRARLRFLSRAASPAIATPGRADERAGNPTR
jgi:hypothetical protein